MGQDTDDACICKDFHKLLKNVKSLSGGQAVVTEWREEDLSWFKLQICPSGGAYYGGKFNFKIFTHQYPYDPPIVVCLTRVYHPNIDPELDFEEYEKSDMSVDDYGDCEPYTNVCVSLLAEDWEQQFTFEDCVQALLFLFYEPNIDDPLSPLIDCGMEPERFATNVKKSLLGLTVDGCFPFERNYYLDDFEELVKGMGDLDIEPEDNNDLTESSTESNSVSNDVKNILNSDPPKVDDIIENMSDVELTFAEVSLLETSCDLVANVDVNPLVMNALPDVVHFSLMDHTGSPKDVTAALDLVHAEPASFEELINCDNLESGLTIDRLGATSVIIDCDERCPDLPGTSSRLQKCISATMWMVKFFFTRIMPEIYKS